MHDKLRCWSCKTQLAAKSDAGLAVRRGGLQITVEGEYRISMVCYQPKCRALNVFRSSSPVTVVTRTNS